MPELSPEHRILRAKIAAHKSWANTSDRAARTAAARRASMDRFDHEVDPDGVLPDAERSLRAAHARKAYFASLALKSAQARRRRSRKPHQLVDDADAPTASSSSQTSPIGGDAA